MPFKCDNTLLSDFASCEAMGIARHVLGLRSKKAKIAADIGNAYHTALELHFRGRGKRDVVAAFETAYDRVLPAGQVPPEPRFEKANCVRIMERYCEVHGLDRFPFEPIEFEKVIGAPLDESGEFIFYGKRDLRIRAKTGGTTHPLDHKTTGRITDWWSRKFRMTSQMSGYCWLESQMTGTPCLECYVNAIEVGKLPEGNRKCATHKVKYKECGKEHAKFELLIYTRTPEQIEKWRQDAIVLARRAQTLGAGFPSIEYLPYAWRNGAFSEKCVFCEYKDWCATGFNAAMADELVTFEKWEPWGA